MKGGDIYTAIVRDNLVTIYNGYTSTGSFLIPTESLSIPMGQEIVFEPQEMIYGESTGELVLLAKVGESASKTTLATFSIDFLKAESTLRTSF